MHKIDARGRVCPLPLFYTKKEIDRLKSGEELEVLTEMISQRTRSLNGRGSTGMK